MRSWNDTYNILIEYRNANGHTNVKYDETFDGVNLGYWVALQRSYYRKNKLSDNQISLLLDLDFSFDTRNDLWNTHFELAKEYKNTFGDLNIPKRYKVSKGGQTYMLGRWLENQRNAYNNQSDRTISPTHIDLLNSIGMDWGNTPISYKGISFNECVIAYYIKKAFPNACKYKNGNIELDIYIPELNLAIEYDGAAWHKTSKDIKKNDWCTSNNITLVRIRENKCERLNHSSTDFYIDPDVAKDLETIIKTIVPTIDVNITRDTSLIHNFYRTSISQSWKDKYALCVDYFNKYGALNFTSTYITDNGVKLGSWLHEQRKSFKRNKLSYDKIELLNNLDMVWAFA